MLNLFGSPAGRWESGLIVECGWYSSNATAATDAEVPWRQLAVARVRGAYGASPRGRRDDKSMLQSRGVRRRRRPMSAQLHFEVLVEGYAS